MRWLRRLLTGLALVVLAAAGPVRPAAADPARPGNVRSYVVAVDPPVGGFTLTVDGGDAFLRLAVGHGHTAEVPGYQGEPYLRVGADGTVEENEMSVAAYLNRSRSPAGKLPEGAGPDAVPVWRRVGGGGAVAWHDHRIHWMGGGAPPQAVTPWEVPVVVDGVPVVVRGRYERVAAPAAWPWWLAVAGASVALGWATRRRVAVAGLVAAGAGLLALPVAWSLATGVGASGASVWAGVALVSLGAALGLAASVVGRRPERAAVAGALVAGAGVSLLLWSARRTSVWSSAVLVSGVPAVWDRAATAAAVVAGVAALVAGGWAVLGPVAEPEPAATVP